MVRHWILALALCAATAVAAQVPVSAPSSGGTVIVMSGSAEVELPNDEAVATFYFETQDPDPTKAQSLVNQRITDGIAALKRADPQADIETAGYSSTPIYSSGSGRALVGWRVRQGVSLRTSNLATLARTVAAAQSTLAVGGIDFRLSRAARERAQSSVIQQAVANLNSRLAAAAQAIGGAGARTRLEEVNFGDREGGPIPLGAARMATMASDAVPAPSFEPGRSIERMTVSAKARLLP